MTSRVRPEVPTLTDWTLAGISTSLLILSFPDFDSYGLAWIALVPLLVAIARRPSPGRALILGWASGTVFFYVTCYWLTYSMINYGGLPTVLAYLLLIPGALVIGIFPGLFALLFALAVRRWGHMAVLLAPVFWTALEWARLGVTGQLWNALGYSQAYNSMLIQAANWGGVYAVSFLIVAINSVVALLIIKPTRWTVVVSVLVAALVGFVIVQSAYLPPTRDFSYSDTEPTLSDPGFHLQVVALQPNVPMKLVKSVEEMKELRERHWSMSTSALQRLPNDTDPRLVIWPESPMNFTYASDKALQEQLATFTKQHRASLLLNSLEPASANGFYNSALLINEEGRLISQYDKIRLMPFGEYVPLPQWLPGASLMSGIVGDFTPGEKYTLMPVGAAGVEGYRAGVFICIESAYPWIARRLTNEGADVLINISNDGYLGPTAVMRQHLANVIFRAVENGRPVVRVTNSGLSAFITEKGQVKDPTSAFQTDVRLWTVGRPQITGTVYTRYGDLFVHVCAGLTFVVLLALLFSRRRGFQESRAR